jgi:predicted dehydrogenase
MLDAAIVGVGRWGQTLVNSVQVAGAPVGELIRFTHGIARTPDKVSDFAKVQNLELSSDFDEALANPRIGAIVLATPHSQHCEQIVAAAAAGKHVFVEKPFTLCAADAVTAAQAARDAGIVLAVGQNRRFSPVILEISRLIEAGEMGTILHVEGNFSTEHGLAYTAEMWRAGDSESPSGGMTGMGIHIIDAFINLVGPIETARALTKRGALDVDIDDTTACLLEFKSGATGYLGTMTATPRHWRFAVFGTKAWAQMHDPDTLEWAQVDQQPETKTFAHIDIERAELEAFATAISGGASYPVPIEQVVHGIAVQDAIFASGNSAAAVTRVAATPL